MEYIIVLLSVALIATLANCWEMKKKMGALSAATENEQEVKSAETPQAEDTVAHNSRDLLIETLTQMGCKCEIEDDDNISFKWQGGYFLASATNSSPFVSILYPQWGEYELYDIDTLSRVKRVINSANINQSVNVVYTINEAGNNFFVHCKTSFLFIRQIPHLSDYLAHELSQFFVVRRYAETELEKLESKEGQNA